MVADEFGTTIQCLDPTEAEALGVGLLQRCELRP